MMNWKGGLFDPQGPVALAERTMLTNATVVMLVVVIPVIILTIAFAWWFRASNQKARRMPDWEYSGAIEVTVWAIPILIIIFLGGMTWVGSHELDPKKPLVSKQNAINIQVVSLDWKWLFIYPDYGIATLNYLQIPSDTPIQFTLTSSGVMNSFFVPQLGSQIYTMAGMATRLQLLATKEGVYPGISAQFSGDGFSDMRFNVKAVSNDAFKVWVEKTRKEPTKLDMSSYNNLVSPSLEANTLNYGKVAEGLFMKILTNNGMSAMETDFIADQYICTQAKSSSTTKIQIFN